MTNYFLSSDLALRRQQLGQVNVADYTTRSGIPKYWNTKVRPEATNVWKEERPIFLREDQIRLIDWPGHALVENTLTALQLFATSSPHVQGLPVSWAKAELASWLERTLHPKKAATEEQASEIYTKIDEAIRAASGGDYRWHIAMEAVFGGRHNVRSGRPPSMRETLKLTGWKTLSDRVGYANWHIDAMGGKKLQWRSLSMEVFGVDPRANHTIAHHAVTAYMLREVIERTVIDVIDMYESYPSKAYERANVLADPPNDYSLAIGNNWWSTRDRIKGAIKPPSSALASTELLQEELDAVYKNIIMTVRRSIARKEKDE